MEILGRYFELTLNLLTTPFFLSVFAGLVLWGIKRIVSALIAAKELRDKERHVAVMAAFGENRDDHKEIFGIVRDHEHRISVLEGQGNTQKKIMGGN